MEAIVHLYKLILTSEANDSLFFSPPEIPRSLPGIPMYVSAHLVRPSFKRKSFPLSANSSNGNKTTTKNVVIPCTIPEGLPPRRELCVGHHERVSPYVRKPWKVQIKSIYGIEITLKKPLLVNSIQSKNVKHIKLLLNYFKVIQRSPLHTKYLNNVTVKNREFIQFTVLTVV